MYELLQKLPDCEDVSEEDFIGCHNGHQKESDNTSDEIEEIYIVSLDESRQILEKTLEYVEQQPNAAPAGVLLQVIWRDYATKNRRTKQLTPASFLIKL
ncbi:hypothetical protein Trydic_g1345 [Trypoxylus dichotomus]